MAVETTITVKHIPKALWQRFRVLCFRRGTTVYQMLTDLIEAELKKAKV